MNNNINNNTSNIVISCNSALGKETPLLVNDHDLTTIGQIYGLRAGKNLEVYALDDHAKIVNSHMINIPKEIYTSDVYDLSFSNEYHLQCSAGSLFLTKTGWRKASELIPKLDKLIGFEFYPESGFSAEEYEVNTSQHISILQQPMYCFMSEHGNILLPKVRIDDTGNQYISFISIKQ